LYSRCLLKHKAEAWFGWELVGERHFTNKWDCGNALSPNYWRLRALLENSKKTLIEI
jgi:hypothetical protein